MTIFHQLKCIALPRFCRFLTTSVLLLLFFSGAAQIEEPVYVDQEYDVSLISPSQLASFTTIQNVHQDSLGFLWIGTNEGLHVLDGNDLLTYNLDSDKMKIGLVKKGDGYFRTAMGRNNILWAAENTSNYIIGIDVLTRQELYRYKVDNFVAGTLRTLDNGETYHIYNDDKEVTWLTCVSCHVKTEKKLFSQKNFINYNSYKNEHWVHTDSALYQYDVDGNLINSYPDQDSLYMNWKYDDSLRFYNSNVLSPKIYQANQQAIVQDFTIPKRFQRGGFHFYKKDDEVWFSDLQHDFLIWNQKTNTAQDYSTTISKLLKEQSPKGLSGDFRFELVLDDGSIIYSKFNSLLRFSKKKLDDALFRESLTSNKQITSMRGLAEDEKGNIYASYYTGVSVKKNGGQRFEPFRDTQTGVREAERTYSLSNWKKKLIWNMAIFDLEYQRGSYFQKDVYGQHVNHCIENDTLWAYEWYANTLIKYSLAEDTYELVSNKLIDNTPTVSDIEIDEKTGLLWFATQYYGILVYDRNGDLVKRYSLDFLGLPKMKNNIFFIEHEGDSVWFGTEMGLGLMNRQSMEINVYNNPIAGKKGVVQGRKIYSVLKNDNGNFYLGTDFGICFFDKKKLKFQNLIPKHPLAGIEFNRNSMLKSKDGRYYFGSIDGLYSFLPDDLQFEDFMEVPKPFFAAAEIFNTTQSTPRYISEELNKKSQLRLKPRDTDLTIKMGAASFENEVLYRYKIPKLKDEWSTYTSNNEVEFISFPSGKFDLQIRTYLRPESENFKESVITIIKPLVWFKRPWVQVLLFAVLGLFIYYTVKRSFTKKLERQEADARLRTKISSDLHDDVGSVLSGLAMQSELASYSVAEEQKETLLEISSMSRSAMDSMRDIVWAIDARKDKYENLIDRMRIFAEKNLSKADIELQFLVEGIELGNKIDPVSRQNYYLIFKEAITNIIKHSDGDFVKVFFVRKGKSIELIIHDNGSEQRLNKAGIGLSNIEMRAKNLGGTVDLKYQEGFKLHLQVT